MSALYRRIPRLPVGDGFGLSVGALRATLNAAKLQIAINPAWVMVGLALKFRDRWGV